MHGTIALTPNVANSFWEAGFQDIDEPDTNGLTPFLQSWFCANFGMVAWFIEKGVSLSSTHRDSSITALHVYAKRIDYPGAFFSHNKDLVPTDDLAMTQIQETISIPYDECTCPCSPHGCTPVKFLSADRIQSGSRKANFKTWLENIRPRVALVQQYVREFTRCLLFNYLGGIHTCCTLGQQCSIGVFTKPRMIRKIQDKIGLAIDEKWERARKHYSYCVDGIPTPRNDAEFLTAATERVAFTLKDLMSRYDEMPRRDSMPPEEQPFQYLNWIIGEKYALEDRDFSCSHTKVDLPSW